MIDSSSFLAEGKKNKETNNDFIETYFNNHIKRLIFLKQRTLSSFHVDLNETDILIKNSQTDVILTINSKTTSEPILKNKMESINTEYSWSHYDIFKIIVCNKNGYFNVPALIEEVINFENTIRIKNNQKIIDKNYYEYEKWITMENTKIIMDNLAKDLNMKVTDLLFCKSGKQKNSEKMLKGCFVHPNLISSIILWISPSYTVLISKNMQTLKNDRIDTKKKDMTQDLNALSNIFDRLLQNNKNILKKMNNTLQKCESFLK